jgi:hypothetical protein
MSQWPADKTGVPYELASLIPIKLVVAFARSEIEKPYYGMLNEQTFSNECTKAAQILETKFLAPTFADLPKCLEMFGARLPKAIGKDVTLILQCTHLIYSNF